MPAKQLDTLFNVLLNTELCRLSSTFEGKGRIHFVGFVAFIPSLHNSNFCNWFYIRPAFFFYFVLAMAGNIIPAIATTNAIVSGLIVMQALNILNGKLDKCKTVRFHHDNNYNNKNSKRLSWF